MHKKFIILVFFISIGIFGLAGQTNAANCGDTDYDGETETICACGDTVVGDTGYTYQLTEDLTCESYPALTIESDSITVDGDGHVIRGPAAYISDNYYAISNSGHGGVTIKNFFISYLAGIRLINANNNIIENNVFDLNKYSITIENSNSVVITNNTVKSTSWKGIIINSNSNSPVLSGNTIDSNCYGVYISSATSTLTNNIFTGNTNDIYNSGTGTYSGNTFLNNPNNINGRMLTFTEIPRTATVNNPINTFTITAKKADGTACVSCTAITLSPSEPSFSYSDNGSGVVTGSFIPTRVGIYSLGVTITDLGGNITKRNYSFFVTGASPMSSTTKRYYLRDLPGTHGQFAGTIRDAGTLTLTAPTSTETNLCAGWVQDEVDEMPDYPFSYLSGINTSFWYFFGVVGLPPEVERTTFAGIQRFSTYENVVVDMGMTVDSVFGPSYTWTGVQYPSGINFTNLNWSMDYPQSWYWLTLKFGADIGMSPQWATFPSGHSDQPSYADFTYSYTTTPAIKSISNPDILVLSATAPVSDTEYATIVLDATDTSDTCTDIVLDNYKRPFIGYTTIINSDGTATLQATDIDGEVTLNSANLQITPDSDVVEVFVSVWNTGGNYFRMWEETAEEGITAEHIVGGLAPNVYYSLSKDGTSLGMYLSDSQGQISFTCPAGSIFTINGINTVFDTDNGSDDKITSTKCFIATAAYGTPMAEEVKILSKFRDEYLLANPIGESFVDTYYKISPRMALFIKEHPILKKIVRIILNPLIWISEKSIE